LQQIDRVIHIGLASWRDEWWFSGNYFLPAVDGNLASHEVAKLSSATDVAFLEDNERVTAFLLAQFKVFKEFNNGQQIVFLPTKKVNDFIRSFIEYHNSNLSMTERKRVKAKQKAQASAALSLFDSPQVQSDFEDSALVFFNPERGIEVATNINSAFPAQYNPYFSADLSDEHLNKMLFNENISPGLCQYCIENHKSQLPFFKEGEGKFYLQDLDFLLRYWKKNKYHPKPIISISEKVRSKH